MNAEQSRRKAASARRAEASKAKQARRQEVEEVVASKKRGRAKAKRQYLGDVHADIAEATKIGKREVVSFMCPGMFGPQDDPATVAFFSGVIERLRELLVAEGYKVVSFINRQHYKPSGSDPILDYSLDYIDPKVEVKW